MCLYKYICVCSENKGSDPSLFGEEGSNIPKGMPVWRQNWRATGIARSTRAKFVVMAVSNEVGWL